MKALSLLLLFFSFSLSFYSQNTLWGTVQKGGQHNYGFLYKTDSIGGNLIVVHHFDSIHSGKNPGPLMQASNGKLYGMTAQGGHGVVHLVGGPTGFYYTQGGTFFEYDPVIDSLKVLTHFNSTDPQWPTNFYNPSALKLLEAAPGILWAVLTLRQNSNGLVAPLNQYIVSYNIATGSMAHVTTVPSWYTPSRPNSQYTSITGVLRKAADGFVYGTTSGYSSCATLADASNGSIIRIDPATNAFSYIKPFNCLAYDDGWFPDGNLEEVNGKFYGRTNYGGPNIAYPTFLGYGLIYEYDPVANTYTRKYDFTGGAMGGNLNGYHIKATNGKLYSTTYRGSTNVNDPYGSGVLYEYDPASNAYTKKYDFGAVAISISDVGPYGALWLSAHSGKLYGTTMLGLFEYNIATNQTRPAARFSMAGYNASATPLIEICMKPTYRFNAQLSYSICAGSFFSYALQSGNADAYTWKHNGTIDASQTSGTLQFNQISLADAGTWVCDMTNACGTTHSPTITLQVNAVGTGVNTSTIAAASTSICPGSNMTLTGNVGGTWNTGSTAASIVVSNPGTYQVSNANACGNTFSNIITIDTIPTPLTSSISFTSTGTMPLLSKFICPGDSVLAFGNANGTWNTGETTPSIYVKDNLPHYVINSNACRSVNSATVQVTFVTPPTPPTIAAAASVTLCTGDSLLLDASGTANYNWYNNNGIFISYVDYVNRFYAKQPGSYYIEIPAFCGPVYSQSIHVTINGIALDTAIITPLSSTVICQGSGVVLQSNYASCTWNTGATTQTIFATGAGPYTVTNYNSCSSVVSAPLTLSVTPAPVISFIQTQNAICPTTGTIVLAPGSPAGGSYSGAGVNGNIFDPLLAGAGTHTVMYTVQDAATGCFGSAIQQISVDYEPLITVAGPTLICQGSPTVLFQTYIPYGTWNTGAGGQVFIANQAGSYYISKTNACGVSVTSNTIIITSKPSPTLSVSGPVTMCAGSSTVLSGSGAASYTWNPGGGTQNFSVNPATTTVYTLTGLGANGCYATAMTTVNVNPAPVLSVNNATICNGTSATLTATGANTYSWSTAQTGASVVVSPTVSTVYNVLGTSVNSCTNMATAVVYVNPAAVIPTVTQAGNHLQSSPSVSYQWYVNGTILNAANSQSYTPTQNGNYTVVITDINGCKATSAIYTITDTGLADSAGKSGLVDVYPNPTTGSFTVNTPFSKFQVQIVNALGQIIQTENGSFSSEFSIGENGLYLIQVIANDRLYIKKLVVSGK
jgi:hypothetical protein